MRHRFPPMAVRCPWCEAAIGDLCTTPSNGRPHTTGTHDVRRIDWVMTTAACPDCNAPTGRPCVAHLRNGPVPLPDVHPSRTTAANQAYATTHAHDQQLQIAVPTQEHTR